MNSEKLQLAMAAINKWLFFCWNYSCQLCEWTDIHGNKHSECLPDFLVGAHWTCNLTHMVEKWKRAVNEGSPNSYLTRFYGDLDVFNRRALLQWVMENYHDERKI